MDAEAAAVALRRAHLVRRGVGEENGKGGQRHHHRRGLRTIEGTARASALTPHPRRRSRRKLRSLRRARRGEAREMGRLGGSRKTIATGPGVSTRRESREGLNTPMIPGAASTTGEPPTPRAHPVPCEKDGDRRAKQR